MPRSHLRPSPESSILTLLSRPHYTLLLLHIILLSCVCVRSSTAPPPPGQYHVYYSGSHVTSIAIQASVSAAYALDAVHHRILQYAVSGKLYNITDGSNPSSASSVSIAVQDVRPVMTWIFVAESKDRWVAVYIILDHYTQHAHGELRSSRSTEGSTDNSDDSSDEPFPVLANMSECGLILSPQGQYQSAGYVVDRYRGYVVRYDLNDSSVARWVSQPPPAASNPYNITAMFLSSATVTDDRVGVIYLLDSVGDRVLRMSSVTGRYLSQPVLQLPEYVSGMLAVSWTWCGWPNDSDGCLWVLYQTNKSLGAERTVTAWSVSSGTVVHSFTVEANGVADRASEAESDSPSTKLQQNVSNAHLASPAMTITGHGTDTDPFNVYLAEADPAGPGHVVVLRDESGTLRRQFQSTPANYLLDATRYMMHAFTAVQAENATCTLWLTDVDNGGLLVRAAADGTILQHFVTPVLLTSVALDVSNANASSPSLVLLSSNATSWQLWRFSPASGEFSPVSTAAVQQQYGQDRRSASASSCAAGLADDAAVAGLAIDGDTGRLWLSLRHWHTVVLLNASGQWDARFNTSGRLVCPGAVVYAQAGSVVVVDRSGEQGQGQWRVARLDASSGQLYSSVSLAPPVSQPLALAYDRQLGRLWLSDASGLVLQLEPASLQLLPGGIVQPMPSAYSVASLAVDGTGTVYGVDRATRRLLLLFVGADDTQRPGAVACRPLPHSESGSLAGLVPLLSVGALSVVSTLVLAVSLYRYWWLRRLRPKQGASIQLDEAAYKQWDGESEVGVGSEPRQRQADGIRTYAGRADLSNTGNRVGAGGSVEQARRVIASDSRYDAYVRLYEALDNAHEDQQDWNEATAMRGSMDDSSRPQWQDTASTSGSSHSSSRFSFSSTRSASTASQLSGDGSGSTSGDAPPAASAASSSLEPLGSPSSIARIRSGVAPHYVDEVTDLRILGEGVSGRVYRGYYRGMAVVVKLPKSREMSTAQWREWQAHLRLPPHPNLVSFVGSLVMCDTNYLVLRWVEQGSLKSLLSQPSTSSTAGWYTRPYAILRAAVDVAGALHHVHRHGLVHRDVSARNVLVALSGTFVLADLGLCQEAAEAAGAAEVARPTALASVTRALHTATTTVPLRWCSPDVLSTWRFTSASDVWALGVTLWEMASGGRLPYDECVRQSEMQQLLTLHRARLSLDKHWAEHHAHTDERHITAAVERLIDTCMTVDVERRPTAEQVRQQAESELARWEVEEPEAAQRVRRQWEDEHAKAGQAAAERERERVAEVAEREVEVADSTAESVAATAAEAVAAREAVAATAASSGVSGAG